MSAVLALRNQAELEELKVQLQQPGSPAYHQWFSIAQFMRRFGPTQSQLDELVDWLRRNHFTIDKTSLGTRMVRFRGTVADVEREQVTD